MTLEDIKRKFFTAPVCLTGTQRGGTTFANRVIGLHPNLLNLTAQDKTMFYWHEYSLRRIFKSRPSRMRYQKLFERELGALDREKFTRLLGSTAMEQFDVWIKHVKSEGNIEDIYCLRGIIGWVMSELNPNFEALSAWVTKTNTYKDNDFLGKRLPSCRFLIIFRAPRAVSLSIAKRRADDGRSHFNNGDIVIAAIDWARQAVAYGWLVFRFCKRAQVIYYEDLVIHTWNCATKIWSFLGLPQPDREKFEHDVKQIPLKRTTSIYDAAFDSSNPQPKGVITEGLTRWQDQLTDYQISVIDNMTSSFGRYIGYETKQERSSVKLKYFAEIDGIGNKVFQLSRYVAAHIMLMILKLASANEKLFPGPRGNI